MLSLQADRGSLGNAGSETGSQQQAALMSGMIERACAEHSHTNNKFTLRLHHDLLPGELGEDGCQYDWTKKESPRVCACVIAAVLGNLVGLLLWFALLE